MPTASDLDSGGSAAPNLTLNCNPVSRFRFPRWLIARFTTLQFEVDQVRNTEALQVVRILHRSKARIFVSLGSCTEHRDHDPDKPPALWAKVDVVSLIDVDTFTHDCADDHIDSESWASRSKVFGDVDRKVRLSFMPSTRMSENVLVVHTELFGSTFEEMLRESNVSLPSLDDLRKGALPLLRIPLSAPYVESRIAFVPSPSSPSSTRGTLSGIPGETRPAESDVSPEPLVEQREVLKGSGTPSLPTYVVNVWALTSRAMPPPLRTSEVEAG